MAATRSNTNQTPDESNKSVYNHIGKEVYTSNGQYVGRVEEIMLSFDKGKIDGFGIVDCNNDLFRNSESVEAVQLDQEWVLSMEDIILIRSTPEETLIAQ